MTPKKHIIAIIATKIKDIVPALVMDKVVCCRRNVFNARIKRIAKENFV